MTLPGLFLLRQRLAQVPRAEDVLLPHAARLRRPARARRYT